MKFSVEGTSSDAKFFLFFHQISPAPCHFTFWKLYVTLYCATGALGRCRSSPFTWRVWRWSSAGVQGPPTRSHHITDSKQKQSDQDIKSAWVLWASRSNCNLYIRVWNNLAQKQESKVHRVSVELLDEGKQGYYHYDLSMGEIKHVHLLQTALISSNYGFNMCCVNWSEFVYVCVFLCFLPAADGEEFVSVLTELLFELHVAATPDKLNKVSHTHTQHLLKYCTQVQIWGTCILFVFFFMPLSAFRWEYCFLFYFTAIMWQL